VHDGLPGIVFVGNGKIRVTGDGLSTPRTGKSNQRAINGVYQHIHDDQETPFPVCMYFEVECLKLASPARGKMIRFDFSLFDSHEIML